jgi:hypothetical protein
LQFFREELESTTASRDKLTARLRALRRFVFWHYVLLLLSLAQSGLALFVVISVDVPFRGWLFWLTIASLTLSCYSLFSGISK